MKKFYFLAIIVAAALGLRVHTLPSAVLAQNATPSATPTDVQENPEVDIPSFPSCQDLLANPGDHASYDQGWHQIVGADLRYGSDDVYSLENGNYVQCFCPEEGDTGIQTDWWKTEEELDDWYKENGGQWNLGDYPYLARNSEFACTEPTPTPTPTDTPEPTPTNTPEPTPTNAPGPTPTPEPGRGGPTSTTDLNPPDPQVLGITSLAATGLSTQIATIGLLFTGSLLLTIGLLSRKYRQS